MPVKQTITLDGEKNTPNHKVTVRLEGRELSVDVRTRDDEKVLAFDIDINTWYSEVRMGILDATAEVTNKMIAVAKALNLPPGETGLSMYDKV